MGLPHLLLLLVSSLIQSSSSSSSSTAAEVDLIHSSRFLPQQELVTQLINMDSARLNRLFASNAAAPRPAPRSLIQEEDGDVLASKLVSASYVGLAQYFVDFQIGTPPQRLILIMDTGSDLIWVKCPASWPPSSPPEQQRFTSGNSTSYTGVTCTENACFLVPAPQNSSCGFAGSQTCDFSYSYNDGSFAQGDLARESMVLSNSKSKSAKVFRDVVFGCAEQLQGDSFQGSAGVLGLGRGPLSFLSQTQLGTFSYCLVDYLATNASSTLAFGKKIIPQGLMKYVPVLNSNATFYYVGVTSVSVAGHKVRGINRSRAWHIDGQGNGGTFFDSGTSLTYLREPAYSKITAKLSSKIKLPRVIARPLDFCYNISNFKNNEHHKRMPELTISFQGGAKFRLKPSNYMVLQQEDLECIAIAPVLSTRGANIIGNLMQRNFHFEFHRSRIGFAWLPCS